MSLGCRQQGYRYIKSIRETRVSYCNLASHGDYQDEITCSLCGLGLGGKVKLRLHMKNEHYKVRQQKQSCKHCGKFYTKRNMRKHFVSRHTSQCGECELFFCSDEDLHRHKGHCQSLPKATQCHHSQGLTLLNALHNLCLALMKSLVDLHESCDSSTPLTCKFVSHLCDQKVPCDDYVRALEKRMAPKCASKSCQKDEEYCSLHL